MKDLLLHHEIVRFWHRIVPFSIAKAQIPHRFPAPFSLQSRAQHSQHPHIQPVPNKWPFLSPKTIINVKNIANFASKTISFSNFQRERTNPKPFVCHFNTFRGLILTFHLRLQGLAEATLPTVPCLVCSSCMPGQTSLMPSVPTKKGCADLTHPLSLVYLINNSSRYFGSGQQALSTMSSSLSIW